MNSSRRPLRNFSQASFDFFAWFQRSDTNFVPAEFLVPGEDDFAEGGRQLLSEFVGSPFREDRHDARFFTKASDFGEFLYPSLNQILIAADSLNIAASMFEARSDC